MLAYLLLSLSGSVAKSSLTLFRGALSSAMGVSYGDLFGAPGTTLEGQLQSWSAYLTKSRGVLGPTR